MQLDDRIRIATPEGVELELQLAGLGSRFMAGSLDLIIQGTLIIVLVVLTGVVSGSDGLDAAAFLIATFAAIFVYPIAFEVLAAGRTPGKRLCHLRVLRDSGDPVDLPASAIRNLMRLIDGITLAYLPTVISILVTTRNQRPGDLAAGTIVIRESPARRRSPTGPPNTYRVSDWDATNWDVSAVTAADLAAVRSFLERRGSLAPAARTELALRLASGLAGKIAGGPSGGEAEQFLEYLVDVKSGRG